MPTECLPRFLRAWLARHPVQLFGEIELGDIQDKRVGGPVNRGLHIPRAFLGLSLSPEGPTADEIAYFDDEDFKDPYAGAVKKADKAFWDSPDRNIMFQLEELLSGVRA